MLSNVTVTKYVSQLHNILEDIFYTQLLHVPQLSTTITLNTSKLELILINVKKASYFKIVILIHKLSNY